MPMLAPNMNLELGLREPVQTSGNSQRPEQKASGPSSFERALERARTEKTAASEPEHATTDETVESQEPVSKEGEKVALKEASSKIDAEINSLEKTLAAKADTEIKGLNIANVVEESTLVSESLPTEVTLAEELDPEALSKELVLQQTDFDQEGEPQVKLPEEGVLVVAEALEEARKAMEQQSEDSEKKTKKLGAKDVDYSIAQILQNGQQGNHVAEKAGVAEGAVAEIQGEIKTLKLETGTSLDQKIEVQDLRTAAENGVTEASLKDGNFVTTVSQGEGTADITLQLAQGTDGSGKTSSVAAGGKENNFGAMLSSQLQNNATELVRTGSIILRDGNMGTINLILHPEELGNVKISLELNDKMVSAQIRVASEEAFQAFKDSIASLKQAFADSGFDTGSFDLSWSGNGQQQQSGQQQSNQGYIAFADTLYGEMMAEDGVDSGVEGEILQKTYSDSSQVAVNIMA
ncbi:MAG: flagellar hook-length control protein FliK [Spirochaetaceae bacterium]|nr:flagellar hook-length control protein FliK [Spirochaetaceae bacterium]